MGLFRAGRPPQGWIHQRHIENLAYMAKQGLFTQARGNVPEASFISGECAMITTSAGFHGNVAKNAKFAMAWPPCPYDRARRRRRTPYRLRKPVGDGRRSRPGRSGLLQLHLLVP